MFIQQGTQNSLRNLEVQIFNNSSTENLAISYPTRVSKKKLGKLRGKLKNLRILRHHIYITRNILGYKKEFNKIKRRNVIELSEGNKKNYSMIFTRLQN